MDKSNVFIGIVFLAVVIIMVATAIGIDQAFQINMDTKNKVIGNEVVLQGDTLTVVNYNFIGETYTLSNGVRVATDLILDE